MTETVPGSPGERRKRATRARIAEAALELFAERGYDAVSVAMVASAASVTEKTVFNHFATKAELVHPDDPWFEEQLVAAVVGRAAGTPVVRALADFLLGRYEAAGRQEELVEGRGRRLARVVDASEALRRREQEMLGRYATSLAHAIATELGSEDDDLRPRILADAVLSVHRATITAYRRRAAASGSPGDDVATRAREAFALLQVGLGSYG